MTISIKERAGRVAPPPNWGDRVEVRFAYRTDVFTARNGTERREAARQEPRISVSYDVLLTREKMQRMVADLAKSQIEPFVVASPWRRVFLSAAVAPGATSITVDAAPAWLAPGAHLVLESAAKVEAVEVESVAGTTVTLASAVTLDFPALSQARLGHEARVEDRVDFRAETATLWTAGLDFEVVPGSSTPVFEAATPTLFEGREVFSTRPNWRERPQVRFLNEREVLDPGHGVTFVQTPTSRTMIEERLSFLAATDAEAEALIGFFARMRGKRGSFWMPTWQRDLESVGPAPSTTEIDVPGTDAHAAYAGSDVYNVVAALWPDGSVEVNRVASVTLAGGNTRFGFTNAWGNPVTASTMLSWCPLWRFATDRLDVDFATATVAEMSFAVRTLPNEEPV